MITNRRSAAIVVVATLVALLVLAAPALGKGKPGGGGTAVNNLSFPAIAVDGFAITPVGADVIHVAVHRHLPRTDGGRDRRARGRRPVVRQKTGGTSGRREFVRPVGRGV